MYTLLPIAAVIFAAAAPGPKQLRGDPKLNVSTAIKDVGYSDKHGPISSKSLFGRGPSFKDVAQGNLGDCDLNGTLSALAHASPKAVEAQFVHDPDGSLKLDAEGKAQVVLYSRDENTGGFHKQIVAVDPELPINGTNGKPEFTQVRNDKLWAPLLEKAVAKFRGGWNAMNNGRSPAADMEMLTGKPAHDLTVNPTPASADEIFAKLQTAVSENRLVAAGTINSGDDYSHRNAQARQSGLIPEIARGENFQGQGVVANHTYAVFGVGTAKRGDAELKPGEKYVTLRNPWDSAVPRGTGYTNGVFRLPLDKFALFYGDVYIGAKMSPASGDTLARK
jgi:Calpain family cysteine protease